MNPELQKRNRAVLFILLFLIALLYGVGFIRLQI